MPNISLKFALMVQVYFVSIPKHVKFSKQGRLREVLKVVNSKSTVPIENGWNIYVVYCVIYRW